MNDKSKQRIDADNAFLRTQTQSMVRDRIASDTDDVAQIRDANTARLRQLRIAKAEQDRASATVEPQASSKPRKRSTT